MLKRFKEHEFLCKCKKEDCIGKAFLMHWDTLSKLEKAREIAGVPFVLNSAQRCPEHNAAEGGSPTSSHCVPYPNSRCRALDIRHYTEPAFKEILSQCSSSRERFEHLTVLAESTTSETAQLIKALLEAGFTRIGVGNSFIHADDDPTKDERVCWLYN